MNNLDVFLNPQSIAIIGASERPGSWGSYLMRALLSKHYPGKIYPINQRARNIFGIPAFKEINDIQGPIDLAVITIPENFVEKLIEDCGRRKVRGIILVTAGYSEALECGKEKESALSCLARSHGMRLLGPNVSGTFNLHANFNGSAAPENHLVCSNLGGITQGGYAFYDLIASAFPKGMGVGKFVHTGNECDLTVTDFLEYYGQDPEVKCIIMYLETIRDGRRFMKIAREVSSKKPIAIYKAGRTQGAARAAQSHTGALSTTKEVLEGLFRQAGIVVSPSMEILFPLGYALMNRPPMRGKRVGVLTVGGSWGVTLSDSIEEEGLCVPEFDAELQNALRRIGMPTRASTKNPVDLGASDLTLNPDALLAIGREVLSSGQVDAMVVHGMCRVGMIGKDTPSRLKIFLDINKKALAGYHQMEKETGIPVLLGGIFTSWESQIVHDLNEQGIPIYNRIDEMAQLLSLMHRYWSWREKNGDSSR